MHTYMWSRQPIHHTANHTLYLLHVLTTGVCNEWSSFFLGDYIYDYMYIVCVAVRILETPIAVQYVLSSEVA